MSRRRFALFGLGFGLAASQAGHLLAYALRFGGAAIQLQSSGAHAYFPAAVKTGLGAVAAVSLAGLLVIGFARIAARGPIPGQPAPAFLRLVAALYTVQLACFALQESTESTLSGGVLISPVVLLMWGTAGQLPVALVAALALRLLATRLGPAIAQLRFVPAGLLRRFVFALTAPALTPAREAVLARRPIASGFSRRGPP